MLKKLPYLGCLLLLLLTGVPVSTYAQSNSATPISITGALLSNPNAPVTGTVVAGCLYRFNYRQPTSDCQVTAVTWTLYDGSSQDNRVISRSTGSVSFDMSFSAANRVSYYQTLQVELGGNCPTNNGTSSIFYGVGTMPIFVTQGAVGSFSLKASANPVCANTPLTLSLAGSSGVTNVEWSADAGSGGAMYSTNNGTNYFAWTLAGGIQARTQFTARVYSCSGQVFTQTITVDPNVELSSVVAGERDVSTGANEGTVTLTNYKGSIQYWQASEDNGASWTTINQSTEELAYTNLTTTTLYRAVTSVCGVLYPSASCPIRVHAVTEDLSWTETKTFALDGTTLTSDSRTYVDGFAKPLQSQAKSLSTGKILATQPLYGRYDQAVGSTLTAPITPTDFAYQPTFITPASAPAAPYDYTRFDEGATLNAPEAVSTAKPNTLGWYYSTNNTEEKYTAATPFPYSRTDAMPDGSTGVSRAVGPAPSLQMGSTHEVVQGSFPVRTELDQYLAVRAKLFTTAAIGEHVSTLQQAAIQSLSLDAEGTSTVVFTDKEGHGVMSARPTTAAEAWASTTNTVEVGWPYLVRIPATATLPSPVLFAATADVMAFDNQGNWLMTGSPEQVAQTLNSKGNLQGYFFYSPEPFTLSSASGNGSALGAPLASQQREASPFVNFYLAGDGTATVTSLPGTPASIFSLVNTVTGDPVQWDGSTPLSPGCYQLRIQQGAVRLTYTNSYRDISYNFYNQKGQLVESIAPKGVQQLLQGWASTGAIPQPTYVTTLEYDQQGRQLATTETDAGRTTFVYRADGKLRFSQNAKQLATGAFSYLGYDAIGRVVEVGECTPNDNNAAFSQVRAANEAWIEDTGYGGAGLLNSYPRRDIVRTTYDQADPVRGPGEAPNTAHNLPDYIPNFLAGRVATTARYTTGQPFGQYELVSQTWFSYDEQGRIQWQLQRAGDGTAIASTGGTPPPATGSTGGANPLAGHWRMEEGSGTTVADASGNANTGTITGTVNWVPGQWVDGQMSSGAALSFSDNGNQGYVRIKDAPSLRMSTTLTMEAWINPINRGYASVILSKDNEYMLYLTTDAHVYCAFNVNSGWSGRQTGIIVPTNNTWTHVAVTYDKGVITAYQNGLVVSTETWGSPTVPIQASGADLLLGGNMFYGAIDEVRLWNTVRTQAQIQTDAGILQASSNPLAGYWRIEEGSGTTVADASSNSNTGAITGTVNWVAGQTSSGKALSFSDNGNQGYVRVGDPPALRMGTTITLEAWINPTNRGNPSVILSKDNEYALYYQTDAHVYFAVNSKDGANFGWWWGGRKTGIVVPTNAWTHIAISYNNGLVRAYQNGVEVSQETWGSPNVPIQYMGSSFCIGGDAGGRPFYGAIDEVRVWNTVRTPDQIRADMTGTTGTGSPGPITTTPPGTSPPVAAVSTAVHTIDYTYDVAGNPATVCYQKNTPAERLTHYYTYDADNRLSLVQTDQLDPASSVLAARTEQARYTYYLHGPLKRVVYGGNLQGLDYTYTASGQLKAINDSDLQYDPGQDGQSTAGTMYPDFFGTSLNYYRNDYASAAVPNTVTYMTFNGQFASHYNGLISGTAWQTPSSPLHGYGYDYDYKGQLQKATYGTLANFTGRTYTFQEDLNRYQEGNLDYDANGNIGHLQRTDGIGIPTLAGAYDYLPNSNQLNQVLNAGNIAVSYRYDAIGQVTDQVENNIKGGQSNYLDYDAGGKVTAIYADAGRKQLRATYTYDEFGKRLVQRVYPNPLDQTSYSTTTFVRDVSGHELASYISNTSVGVTSPTFLYEQPIYGATRLGILRQARNQNPTEQLYELNDHLGNTRIVFRRPTTTTYMLSMENAQASQEQQDFPGPVAATYGAVRSANYSLPSSIYNAPTGMHYSSRLLNTTGLSQGPTKTITAQRGDKLHLTAYGLYNATGSGYNITQPPTTSASMLSGAEVFLSTGPRVGPVEKTTQPVSSGLQRSLSQVAVGLSVPLLARDRLKSDTQESSASFLRASGPPDAYLYYEIYKASDHTPVRSGRAALQPTSGVDWQPLSLDVEVTEDYPVLVEIATKNNDTEVAAYFDDLLVEYTPGPVIEENHYYAYGERLDGLSWRRTDERLYGRGYQGQYTTQDAESGYTAFDLRMYSSLYGRWISTDPKKQFYSPYVSMSNNPVSNNDIDGGEASPIFSTETGDFLGTDSEGFTGEILYMKASTFDDLKANSKTGVIDHGIARNNSLFASSAPLVSVTNSFNYIISMLPEYCEPLSTYGMHLANNSVSVVRQSSISGLEWTNFGDEGAIRGRASYMKSPFFYNGHNRVQGGGVIVTYGDLFLANTVENVQNIFVHEYGGHGLGGYSGENTPGIYLLQMHHPTYKLTSKDYKTEIESFYRQAKGQH